MATYILVSGAWHGSWCWAEVVKSLASAGHCVIAPDLIGMSFGDEPVTEEPVRQWADQISDIIRAQPDPVILVGHSRGGIVISEVAERVPDRISLLVYLSAFLLKNGESIIDFKNRVENSHSLSDAVLTAQNGTCTLIFPKAIDYLYSNTPSRFIDLAKINLSPEPLASLVTPINVSSERFGSVIRAYIECIDDKAISIDEQRFMQQSTDVQIVKSLDSDHSPFFSQPEKLTKALEACAVGAASFSRT